MHDLMIDLLGATGGVACYGIARIMLGRRGARRDNARRVRLDGLLSPYDGLTVQPIPVRDELPPNVLRLRPRTSR